MPAFFLRNSKLLQHHAIHCKATIWCRKNRSTSEIEREANHIPFWSSLLFNKEKLAAFHLEIEALDRYDQWDYRNFLDMKKRNRRNVDVGPTPSLYSFFRQNFVLNTTRLWLDFSGKRDESASEKSIEDVLYSDWRLVDECIRWLNLPLPIRTENAASTSETQCIERSMSEHDWHPPPLTGCERILHIGSERCKLNMKQITEFVNALINVRSTFFC